MHNATKVNLSIGLWFLIATPFAMADGTEHRTMVPLLRAEFSSADQHPRSINYVPREGSETLQIDIARWRTKVWADPRIPENNRPVIEATNQADRVGSIKWLPPAPVTYDDEAQQSASKAEAWLWNGIAGTALEAHHKYTFSVEVQSIEPLDAKAWHSRGFGLGVSTGADAHAPGKLLANSLREPDLLQVKHLAGTVYQLSIAVTTGALPPQGDVGLVVFALRQSEDLPAAGVSGSGHVAATPPPVASKSTKIVAATTENGAMETAFSAQPLRRSATRKKQTALNDSIDLDVAPIPEPTTATLLLGALPLCGCRFRRKASSKL